MNGIDNELPLLSICIPTYNRAPKLEIALNALLIATKEFTHLVEIIVSDNCSDDNTQELVLSYKAKCKNIYYYRNNSNLGFNRNIFLLSDDYARAKFCWIIGDDDFVDSDSIYHIIGLLQHNIDLKLLMVNFRFATKNEYESLSRNYEDNERQKIDFLVGSFSNGIDALANSGNILGTFMSSHIFLKEYFAAFNKAPILNNTWTNYDCIFPNAYIIATEYSSYPVFYTTEPLITCIPDVKSWDDKLQFLHYKTIPDLYAYYLKLGCDKKELKKTFGLFAILNVYNLLLNIKRMKAVPFAQIAICLKFLLHPSVLYSFLLKILKLKK